MLLSPHFFFSGGFWIEQLVSQHRFLPTQNPRLDVELTPQSSKPCLGCKTLQFVTADLFHLEAEVREFSDKDHQSGQDYLFAFWFHLEVSEDSLWPPIDYFDLYSGHSSPQIP